MAFVRTLQGKNDTGFDPDLNLLVIPAGRTGSLYLVDTSVLGTAVEVDKPDVVAMTEADQPGSVSKRKEFANSGANFPITLLTFKGLKAGTATLTAKRTVGSDGLDPVTIRVVDDPNARQSGAKGAISPAFRDELQAMPSLRAGVLRVAEDQMYSKIGRAAGGFGVYADKSYDWCGAFAWYCWNVACTARNVANPFGTSSGSLLSCQKAVSWALQYPHTCKILRYEGGDPYGNSFTTGKALKETERQEYVEISPANPVQPADIMILRNPTGWQHVALVWQDTPADADRVQTIDGNQGYPCISRNSRDMKAKVNKGKDYAVIFLHVRDSFFHLIDI